MPKQLKAIDSNKLGDYLDEYCNDTLNKRLRKFLILDEQTSIENILDQAGFTEVTSTDIDAGIAVAEATLVEVNRVLKAQGIEFEFKSFDAIEYTTYMLVNTNDKVKATAQRVRDFRLKQEEKTVDTAAV
jgi:hypothetical protein